MSEFSWLRFLLNKIRRVANSEASVAETCSSIDHIPSTTTWRLNRVSFLPRCQVAVSFSLTMTNTCFRERSCFLSVLSETREREAERERERKDTGQGEIAVNSRLLHSPETPRSLIQLVENQRRSRVLPRYKARYAISNVQVVDL